MHQLHDFFQLSAPFVQPVDLINTLLALLVALALSFGVAALYMYENRHRGYEQTFVQSLVFIGVIVAGVIMVVGTNIAGAFGLVGAVSIIRFRTKLADTKDTAYMFLAITVGLACGLHHYLVGLSVTLLVAGIVGVFTITKFAKDVRKSVVRVLSVRVADVAAGRRIVERILLGCTNSWELLSIHAIDEERAIIDYRLTLIPGMSAEEALQVLLEKSNGVFTVLRFDLTK